MANTAHWGDPEIVVAILGSIGALLAAGVGAWAAWQAKRAAQAAEAATAHAETAASAAQRTAEAEQASLALEREAFADEQYRSRQATLIPSFHARDAYLEVKNEGMAEARDVRVRLLPGTTGDFRDFLDEGGWDLTSSMSFAWLPAGRHERLPMERYRPIGTGMHVGVEITWTDGNGPDQSREIIVRE